MTHFSAEVRNMLMPTARAQQTAGAYTKNVPAGNSSVTSIQQPAAFETSRKDSFGIVLCLEFLVVFFVSLQGYYYYQINLAPFPIAGFGILLLLCLHAGVRVLHNDSAFIGMVLLVLAASTIVGTLAVGGENSWRNTVGSFVGPLFGLAFVTYFRNRLSALMKCLKATLLVHVAAGTTQFICFYVLGFYPDFLEPVTGEVQRYVGTSDLTGMARPTGLFPEPAHYALWIIVMVFMISRFRIPVTLFQIFALLTAIANFSLLGIAMTTAFFAFYWLSDSRRILMKIATIIVAGAVLIYGSAVIQNASTRVQNIQSDVSYNSRFTDSFGYFGDLPTSAKFFGTGIGVIDSLSYGSVYSYFLIRFGIILTLALLGCGIWYLRTVCRTSLLALSYVARLFLGTLMPTYGVCWMVIAASALLEKAATSPRHERSPGIADNPMDGTLASGLLTGG